MTTPLREALAALVARLEACGDGCEACLPVLASARAALAAPDEGRPRCDVADPRTRLPCDLDPGHRGMHEATTQWSTFMAVHNAPARMTPNERDFFNSRIRAASPEPEGERPRRCNRHKDCAEADRIVQEATGKPASHCPGPDCGPACPPAPRPCPGNSPPWFKGRWRDWHRGHGCDKDDGKPRTPEGEAEIARGAPSPAADAAKGGES